MNKKPSQQIVVERDEVLIFFPDGGYSISQQAPTEKEPEPVFNPPRFRYVQPAE